MALEPGLSVTASVWIPASHLVESFSRNSGPGGQSVNTADSRVELRFDVARYPGFTAAQRQQLLTRLSSSLRDGVVLVTAAEHRQQLANREAARERLATILRQALAPPPKRRRPTRPSRGSVERRITKKKQRSALKRSRRNYDD